MAPKPVTLTFAGDSASLEKTFVNVGAGAKAMAGDLDSASGKAKSLDGAMGKVGSTVDSSESKFMGTADVLDGLATTMGLNVGAQIEMARGFGDIAGGLTNLAPMLSGLATKLGLTSAATWAWNAAQTALNFVMSMNPIMLVVLAIGALVAALVIAYKNSETFRDIVDGVFKVVKQVVGDAIGWILDGIGQFLGALARILEIAGKIPGVGNKFDAAAAAVRSAQGDVKGLADKMHNLGEEADTTAEAMKRTFAAYDQLKASGGAAPGPGYGSVGRRAAGGPVSAGRAYIVGEHRPELFVPDQSGTIVPAVGTSSSTTVTINVSALDGPGAATAVVRALDEYESRNGARYARV